MTAEWKEQSLGDVIDIKHGFAFSGEHIHDEPRGDILLTPGNFEIGGGFKGDKFKHFDGEVPDEFVLNPGDLLVTMTDLSKQGDTLGYPAIVPNRTGRRYLHNQRLGKVTIKSNEKVDQRFLFYLLCTREYRRKVLASRCHWNNRKAHFAAENPCIPRRISTVPRAKSHRGGA